MRTIRAHRAVALTLSLSLGLPRLQAQEAGQSPAAVTAFRAGQEAFQHEEFDAAIAQFKVAIAADPRFAAAHCALGQTYMTTRRYAEAVATLVQCKAATERQAAAQASARAEQDRAVDREIVELRDSINQIRSGQSKTGNENTIVRLEQRLRTLEESRNRGAAARSGVPPTISFALGTAYLRAGSLEPAERELREALKQRPDYGDAHNNLAAVYVALGRWDDAAREVQLAEAAGAKVSPALKRDVAARHASAAPASPSAPGAPAAVGTAPPGAAAGAAPAAEPPPAVEHTPLACVASSAFPRVTARVTPAAATAKVFFRTDADAGWYAIRLRSDDERYAAVLPRPRSARSFRYYIEATGEDTRTSRTTEYVASVVDRAESCRGKTSDSVATASGILVEPPAAARAGLVPHGFSARGTVGDVGQFEMGTKVAIGAGVLLAGAAVAGAAAAAGRSVPVPPATTLATHPEINGDVTVVGSVPGPGGTVSFSGGSVSITFRVVSPYAVNAGPARITFAKSVPPIFANPCATVIGTHPDLRPMESITMTVTGHLTNDGICGPQFDAHSLRVILQETGGPQIFQTGGLIPDLPIMLSFVP